MMKIALCGAIIGVISLSAQDLQAEKAKLDAEAKMLQELKTIGVSMVNGPTVKGAPYSAEAANEMVQTLADGNHIKNTNSSMLYRDSQGRERREESVNGKVRSIFITDPVDGVSYMLQPNAKEARKTNQSMVVTADGRGSGVGVGRGGALTETYTFTTGSSGNNLERVVVSSGVNIRSKADSKVEHLGTQTIEGVSAEGTRTTITIPAGQIGNELPIVTVSERWYSPELQVTVMSTRSDPRTGTTTYKLTNINRAEPSPALFQVPADYTVNDTTDLRRKFPRPEEQ